MLNIDIIKESEVPGLDDDTLNAAVAKWCEGCIVEWGPNIKGDIGWRVAKDKDCWLESLENSECRYLTDGNAAFRLMVKYELWVHPVLKGGWVAYKNMGTNSRAEDPHRAVAEAALMVELRRQAKDAV